MVQARNLIHVTMAKQQRLVLTDFELQIRIEIAAVLKQMELTFLRTWVIFVEGWYQI